MTAAYVEERQMGFQCGEGSDNVTENERGEKWLGGCLARSPSRVRTYLEILRHCLLAVAAFRSKTGPMTRCDYHLIMLSLNERMSNGLLIKCTVKSGLITGQL